MADYQHSNGGPEEFFTKFAVFTVGGGMLTIPFFGFGPLLVVFAALGILLVLIKQMER